MAKYDLVRKMLEKDLDDHPDQPIGCDTAVSTVSAHSLRASFYKKLAPQGISKAAKQAALDDFVECNRNCGLREPSRPVDDDLLFAFKYAMGDLLGWRFEDDSSSLFTIVADRLLPGPGASKGHNNLGGFFEKYFQGPVSCTDEHVLRLYRGMIMRQPSWAAAELQRFHEFGVLITDSSTLFYAPKNAEIARACCTEPGINMLLQRGVGEFIEDRLKTWGINLEYQSDLNKNLAKIGSVDDNLVTLDLKSSSNSVSLALVNEYVPTPLRGWLTLTRSPFVTLPGGEKLEMKMVSSMGNGYTFPLQTAIFTCIVKACHALKDIPFERGLEKRWGVFGDDIIVEKRLLSSVLRLLFLLGFTVNEGKSFTVGPFRESCGGDYYRGHNVRGVYVKSLESDPQIYSALNRLNRWSVRHGIPLRNTCRVLMSFLRRKVLVPRFEGDDAGLHVQSIDLPSRVYRCWVPRRSERVIPVDSETTNSPEYLAYSYGLYVALLGGYISSRTSVIDSADPCKDPPPLLIVKRSFGSTQYRLVSKSAVGDYDWPGLQDDPDRRDASWGAVVWYNCF